MFKRKCFGTKHWADKDPGYLFTYGFQAEPQAGDTIWLSPDELDGEEIPHIIWTVTHRRFEEGEPIVILRPKESTTGIVPAGLNR